MPVTTSVTSKTSERVLVAVKGVFEQGQLRGYIVEEISLSFFEKVRSAVNIFNDGTIYLTDNANQIITTGNTADSRQNLVLTEEERNEYNKTWETKGKYKQQGFLRYKIRGEQYLSYYIHLNDVDWRMMATVNGDQILQTRANFRQSMLLLIFLLAVSSILIHKIISSEIGKPLDSFVQTFHKIKKTSDYSLRMGRQRSQEMNIIFHEMKSLLANVQTTFDIEKAKQRRLKEKVSIDELTGLYNKWAMKELMSAALDISRVEKKIVACFFIDVDNFKIINTQYGHIHGDEVLYFVAKVLKARFRF